MWDILKSIRSLLLDHLANSQPLQLPPLATPTTVLLNAGDPNIYINNTSRFRINDKVMIVSDVAGIAEPTKIIEIPSWNHIIIDPPSIKTGGWVVSESPYVLKAIEHKPLKRIHIGDLKVIPSFPTVTITPQDESNEWLTFLGTSHEYKLSIRTYVQADGMEHSEEVLSRYSEQIREILIDHIHPIIDGKYYPLTADLPSGSVSINITDTSEFYPSASVVLKDAARNSQNGMIESVIDETTLQLATACDNDYLVSRQAQIVLLKKYLYDTRPSSISYGYVPGGGGSFVRASEIGYFGKEFICRQGNVQT